MYRLPKPYTWKRMLLVCALTLFLLPSLSDAFGVSSSRALKVSRGERMGRPRRAQFRLVAETTELVANAAAISVGGDPFWQRLALGFVETGGAGGIATVLAVLLGVIPLLEKAITGQAKVGIGELRCEIRELRSDMKTDLNKTVESLKSEIKTDSESLENKIMTAVVVVPLLTAVATAALVLWMMKIN